MTSESEVSYLACVEVGDDVRIPVGMTGRVLAPQTYAVFTHRGPTDNLDQTYQYIFGTYFPRTGTRAADAPDFELYDQRFDPQSTESAMEIYIPVDRECRVRLVSKKHSGNTFSLHWQRGGWMP